MFPLNMKIYQNRQNLKSKRIKSAIVPISFRFAKHLAKKLDFVLHFSQESTFNNILFLLFTVGIYYTSLFILDSIFLSFLFTLPFILISTLSNMNMITISFEELVHRKVYQILPTQVPRAILLNGLPIEEFYQFHIDETKDVRWLEDLQQENIFILQINAVFSDLLKKSQFYHAHDKSIAFNHFRFSPGKSYVFKTHQERKQYWESLLENLKTISYHLLYQALDAEMNIEDIRFYNLAQLKTELSEKNEYFSLQLHCIEEEDCYICHLKFIITHELFEERVHALKLSSILHCQTLVNHEDTIVFEAKSEFEAYLIAKHYTQELMKYLEQEKSVMISYIRSQKEKELRF